MLFPCEVFFFSSFSHDTYTFIFLVTSFFCIFSLIPLLIQVLMSQRLLLASSVGINLTVPNFRVCFFASVHFTSEIEFSKLVHSKLHLCKLLSCRISISHVLMKHNNDNSLCKMLTMLVNTDDGLYIYYSHLHLCSHLKHHCFCSDFELHPSNMHKTPACQCLIKTV